MKKLGLLLVILVLIVSQGFAETAIFTCSVPGAKIQIQGDHSNNYCSNTYSSPFNFPKVLECYRNDYLMVKVTAPDCEDFECGYDINRPGANNFEISLISINADDPEGLPLFGFGGQIISKRGLAILPNTYKVLCRNMTRYKRTDGSQVSQDVNYNDGSDGSYSAVFANFAQGQHAVAIGDRVFVGVFNSGLTRCYGFKFHTINEDDMGNGGLIQDILIR